MPKISVDSLSAIRQREMIFYKGRYILPLMIQSPVASSEHLQFAQLLGSRMHGNEKSLEIGKEYLNVSVLNSKICLPSVLVYMQPYTGQTFNITICKSEEGK